MRRDQLTTQDIRQANKLNALYCLLDNEKMTIAQLAAECGATIVTMGKIMQSLVDDGIVRASVNDTGGVGRHGLTYEVDLERGAFVCFDVTFRKRLAARTYDLKQNQLASFERNVSGGDYFAQFGSLINEVKESFNGRQTLGVGVSTAGVYDKTRDSARSVLFDWYHEVGFSGLLRDRFTTRNLIVGQDVSFAALAENRRLATGANQSLYYLYVGDGISGAFIKNGKIHEGVDGISGNPGQLLVTWGNRLARLEETISPQSLAADNFNARMRPLFTVMHNIMLLLDPDYFVISANDVETAKRVRDGLQAFTGGVSAGRTMLGTRFVLSDSCSASQAGVLQKLVDHYLRAL